ncbi:hypothetical protein E1B28_003803 [Marasmius oreades]|uniref:Prolyl 4-hydroxylase alpha subunit Fe(2+) 2OG dioxygenase domain-containing protein n=1 Tax=Marasmius oreades TaxID=181124 RepID=A0A9P8ABI9_9AGAR|nr:uncharacterized protein E1B28_003803 [Marasmius oreades]KAG7096359.1 hypothetical protein E1B28_003803 [Marasmius oreades]
MKHSRNELTDSPVNPDKKQKTDDETEQNQNFSRSIRTAFDINFALSDARLKFRPIGNVVTVWPFEDHPVPKKTEREILNKLSELNKEANKLSQPYCVGTLKDPFYLEVTYAGCEFKRNNLRYGQFDSYKNTIQKWLENAPVSGFGDNRVLETKVDPEVRKACEIPAEGFKVNSKLLDTIAKIWSTNFLPAKVRVEPYKIHIYGKGGHFKSHRDTPEKLLVGTFLLGIDDTTMQESYGDYDEESDVDAESDDDAESDVDAEDDQVVEGDCDAEGGLEAADSGQVAEGDHDAEGGLEAVDSGQVAQLGDRNGEGGRVAEGNLYAGSGRGVQAKSGFDQRAGNFCIGNIQQTAKTGHWVAFYPDVPHSVEPLTRGYRAAIAFKIYSLEGVNIPEEVSRRYPSVIERTKTVLAKIKGPYGIILQHHYPMGTDADGLVGVDAVILSAAKQIRPNHTVRLIPIMVRIHEERIMDPIHDIDSESCIDAIVYPFTRHHVDICLGRSDDNTKESIAWIKDVKNLPFFSWDFKEKSMMWSSEEDEINHTGNESDGTRETSVYLAYAIVVL